MYYLTTRSVKCATKNAVFFDIERYRAVVQCNVLTVITVQFDSGVVKEKISSMIILITWTFLTENS